MTIHGNGNDYVIQCNHDRLNGQYVYERELMNVSGYPKYLNDQFCGVLNKKIRAKL